MKSKLNKKTKQAAKPKLFKGNKFAKSPVKHGKAAPVGKKSDKAQINTTKKSGAKADAKSPVKAGTKAGPKTVHKASGKSDIKAGNKTNAKTVAVKNNLGLKKNPEKKSAPVAKKTSPQIKKPSVTKKAAVTVPKSPTQAKPLIIGTKKNDIIRKALNSKKAAEKAKTSATLTTESNQIGLEELSVSLIEPGKPKEKIWRTKNFNQFPAQHEFGFPDFIPELPTQYNETKLVLMPKDPEYMFCYWELTPDLLAAKEKEKQADAHYKETLKINWDSKSLFEPNFTFIPVFFWARKWYFGVPQVGQRYQVELGWLSDKGHFISLIGSNLSELPENWTATQKRLAEQGDILSYSSKHTQTLGSSENLVVEDYRTLAPEWNLSSESMSSSSWSRGVSQPSSAESLSTKSSAGKRLIAAHAKLEVAGKVFSGSTVAIAGKRIHIDSNGNFQHTFTYDKENLTLEVTGPTGMRRTLTYDLKELILS